MRRIGFLVLIAGTVLLLVIVGLTAAGRGTSAVVQAVIGCFWGALAAGLAVRLVRARLSGRSVRKALQPVTDAAAVYNELITGAPPAAVQAQRLPNPPGDDRESAAGPPA